MIKMGTLKYAILKLFQTGELVVTECPECDGTGLCEETGGWCSKCHGKRYTVEEGYDE